MSSGRFMARLEAEALRDAAGSVDPAFLARQLAALGIQEPDGSTDEKVYRFLVDFCKREGRTATASEIMAGLQIKAIGTVRSALMRLAQSGRAINPRRGVFYPVVVE